MYNTLRWSTSLLLSVWVVDAIRNNKLLKVFILTVIFSLCFRTDSFSLLVPVLASYFQRIYQKKCFFYILVQFFCLRIYIFITVEILYAINMWLRDCIEDICDETSFREGKFFQIKRCG